MAEAKRITLAEIGKLAGVHATTVSLALRNHPRIPERTRTRIREIAQKAGYAPDPMLRALVSYRSRSREPRSVPTLAYLTHWQTRWGWKKVIAHPDFYRGASEQAQALGYKLEHFWLGEPGLTHDRLNRILRARGIRGLILASHSLALGDYLQMDWSQYSAIKIDYWPHEPALHTVTNHQSAIVALAMKKVLAAGYRRLGFVMHRGWDISCDQGWTTGFLGQQQNVKASERIPPLVFPDRVSGGWDREFDAPSSVAPEDFRRWFERYRPQVIISKDTFVLPSLRAMGVKIPQHVAFVDLFLEATTGETAGVRQNHASVGALAVE